MMTTLDEPLPASIIFRPPPGTPLGTIMNEVRIWLDAQKIEPLDFCPVTDNAGTGFLIRFRDHFEANRFRQSF